MNVFRAPPAIDTEHFSADFQKAENDRLAWRNRVWQRVVHKAFNLPMEDEMGDINTSRRGMGWPELAIVAAMVLGTAAVAWSLARPVQAPETSPAQVSSPVDSEYEVRFYDKDGNLIEVPRLPADEE